MTLTYTASPVMNINIWQLFKITFASKKSVIMVV